MIISSNNKKSEHTKEKLTLALFQLMQKEYFSQITVLQITQYAEVSRAAFYRNFETKEDIIHYSVYKKTSEFIKSFEPESEEIFFDAQIFIDSWIQEKEYFRLLHKNDLIPIFISEYQKFMSQHIKNRKKTEHAYYDYLAACMSYGTIALLDIWLQHDCRETKDELLEIIEQLRNSMYHRYIG